MPWPRDTAAMNLNPAGITQIPGNALDMYGGIIYPVSVAHRDRFGNDLEVWNRRAYLGGGGFTHRLGDGPVTVGIGLFGQGGAGNVYKNVVTPFGTSDELSSLLRIAKITPTVAYRFDDKLSLGLSLQVVVHGHPPESLPRNLVLRPRRPRHPFFGTDVEMNGFGFGVKAGGAVQGRRPSVPCGRVHEQDAFAAGRDGGRQHVRGGAGEGDVPGCEHRRDGIAAGGGRRLRSAAGPAAARRGESGLARLVGGSQELDASRRKPGYP